MALTGTESTVTVRELNQNTSAVLARVQKGEKIVITMNGTPAAKLYPLSGEEALLERLVREGRATRATGGTPLHLLPGWSGAPGVDLAAELAAERDAEGRW